MTAKELLASGMDTTSLIADIKDSSVRFKRMIMHHPLEGSQLLQLNLYRRQSLVSKCSTREDGAL